MPRSRFGWVVAIAAFLFVTGSVPLGHAQPMPSNVPVWIRSVEDQTIFTLFALLNAAGYDDENRPAGMHPVRLQVRDALADLDPGFRAELRRFYDRHRAHATPWSYSVAAKASSGPPRFAPTPLWKHELAQLPEFKDLSDLHPLLRRFYTRARVPELYGRVRPAYWRAIEENIHTLHFETIAAMEYTRVEPESLVTAERRNPVIVPNLLDSYEHAFSFILDDRFWSIEGPQQALGYNPHEFIHSVTNPAVYSSATRARSAALRPLFDASMRALGDGAAFESIEAWVDENLVRTVALRYSTRGGPEAACSRERSLREEYLSGYILMSFFWSQLTGFENGSLDLRQAYTGMLEALDPAAELRAWRLQRGAAQPDSSSALR